MSFDAEGHKKQIPFVIFVFFVASFRAVRNSSFEIRDSNFKLRASAVRCYGSRITVYRSVSLQVPVFKTCPERKGCKVSAFLSKKHRGLRPVKWSGIPPLLSANIFRKRCSQAFLRAQQIHHW
jgi:hypothetical protein